MEAFPSPRGVLATSLLCPTATILIIDDQQASRGVAYRLLTEAGYRVLEATGCAEALDDLCLAHGRVDLVLVNVVMPQCDGVAVGRHVQQRWPDQRILYMSADPPEVLAGHGLPARNVPFLPTPYTREEVLAKVKETIETSKPKIVMVVDDQLNIRSALGRMLSGAGYEVILAANGDEATRLWRERAPDLVILDLFMPEKDGIETIVELLAYSPGIPIIAMSGGGAGSQFDVLKDARLLGAVATIAKPFERQVMMDLVARSLGSAR